MMNDTVSRKFAPGEDFLPRTGDQDDHREMGVDPFRIGELAHELRQPLSTIESLAYYLELTTENDHIRRQLERIRLMVDRANQILAQASLA
jgi:nitrogen-specific signal transduction histidine kinase